MSFADVQVEWDRQRYLVWSLQGSVTAIYGQSLGELTKKWSIVIQENKIPAGFWAVS